jgi:ribonuclease HI
METARTFLDENRGARVEVTWVPGHMGIEGNDRADELAKEATELEPITEITTIAKLHWQIHDRLKNE